MAHVHDHQHCPTCGQEHTTITGDVLLKCGDRNCKAVWRRVDVELEAKQDKDRQLIREQERDAFIAINKEVNSLVEWMRDHRPLWLTGTKHPIKTAIQAMKIADELGCLPVQSPWQSELPKGRLSKLWHVVKTLR